MSLNSFARSGRAAIRACSNESWWMRSFWLCWRMLFNSSRSLNMIWGRISGGIVACYLFKTTQWKKKKKPIKIINRCWQFCWSRKSCSSSFWSWATSAAIVESFTVASEILLFAHIFHVNGDIVFTTSPKVFLLLIPLGSLSWGSAEDHPYLAAAALWLHSCLERNHFQPSRKFLSPSSRLNSQL